jgi:hypothetical protein
VIVPILVWLAVAGLAGIGAAAILVPRVLSQLYGAPVSETNAIAFVRAAGVRDVLLAAILAFAKAEGFAQVVTVTCAAGALLAAADFVLTLGAANGRLRREHLSHVGGFAGFALIAVLSMRG